MFPEAEFITGIGKNIFAVPGKNFAGIAVPVEVVMVDVADATLDVGLELPHCITTTFPTLVNIVARVDVVAPHGPVNVRDTAVDCSYAFSVAGMYAVSPELFIIAPVDVNVPADVKFPFASIDHFVPAINLSPN
jgi:hypothetical protein